MLQKWIIEKSYSASSFAKFFQENSIFWPFESMLIGLSRCVKCESINGNSRKENHLPVAVFAMSQPTNLKSLLWGQYFLNLPQNQNAGAMIQQSY